MYSELITVDGEEFLLLCVEPDWTSAVRTMCKATTDAQASVTGVQERRPEMVHPLWEMSYGAQLADGELQQLRSVLGALEGRRVIMPFWPDAQSAELYPANDLFAGSGEAEGWLSWDHGFANVAYSDGLSATQEGRDFVARAMIGRLDPVRWDPELPSHASIQFRFREDCYPLPALAMAGHSGGWAWEADWTQPPRQGLVSLQDLRQMGRVARMAEEGEPVTVYTQQGRMELDRPDIRGLMRFYGDHGGHVAFEMPSVLTPGAATPTAPHHFDASSGRVFFRGAITIDWYTPDAATVSFAVEQQIETADHEEDAPAHLRLYVFRHGEAVTRLTDYGVDVVDGADTYTAARIEHDGIVQSLVPQDDLCRLDVYYDDLSFTRAIMLAEAETPVEVDVYEAAWTGVVSGKELLYQGQVVKCRGQGKMIELEVAPMRGALRRQIPRFQFSHTCNHSLFSAGCTARRPAEMAKAAWQSTAQWVAQGADLKLQVEHWTLSPSIGLTPDNYFAGGWVEVGSGANRQVRVIAASQFVASYLYLQLTRPFREEAVTPGDTVTFWPGCDGQFSTCKNVFNNTDAFGGMPYIPTYIKQAPRGMPKGGK